MVENAYELARLRYLLTVVLIGCRSRGEPQCTEGCQVHWQPRGEDIRVAAFRVYDLNADPGTVNPTAERTCRP
jgi:hypothetical protein